MQALDLLANAASFLQDTSHTGTGRTSWDESEVAALIDAVRVHGTNWDVMLNDPKYKSAFSGRTIFSLKSKWGRLRAATHGSNPRTPKDAEAETETGNWDSLQVKALKEGVAKYGTDWSAIVKDPDLSKALQGRTCFGLKSKWNRIKQQQQAHSQVSQNGSVPLVSPTSATPHLYPSYLCFAPMQHLHHYHNHQYPHPMQIVVAQAIESTLASPNHFMYEQLTDDSNDGKIHQVDADSRTSVVQDQDIPQETEYHSDPRCVMLGDSDDLEEHLPRRSSSLKKPKREQ